LIQSPRHVADRIGDVAIDLIVGIHQYRARRLSKIRGEAVLKLVVVHENGVEWPVKQFGRKFAVEVVESNVQVYQVLDVQSNFGKQPRESVVAQIQLK
jgi:hypothetical protein